MNDPTNPTPPPAGKPAPVPQPDNTPPPASEPAPVRPAPEPVIEPAPERQVFDEPEIATPTPEPVATEPTPEPAPVVAEAIPTPEPAPAPVAAEPTPTAEPVVAAPEPVPEAVIQGAPERSGDKPEPVAEAPAEQAAAPSDQPIFGGQTPAPAVSAPPSEAPTTSTGATATTKLPANGTRPDGTPLSGEEKLFGAIGYIDILALVPLLARRDSEYCQHHGRQGLIVAVIFIFLWILAALSSTLAWIIVPLRIITIVAGFYLAYQGDWFQIPGIYDVSLKLKLDKPKPPRPPQA